MAVRSKPAPKSKPPTRVQIYLAREDIAAALEREARFSGKSLSQAASSILERGLRGQVRADPDDRLLALERRVAEQGRRAARDLIIIEEIVFITLRTIFSRMPETAQEQDPAYRGAVDDLMQGAINEVAERLRATKLGREAARTGDPSIAEVDHNAAAPGALAANDPSPAAATATSSGPEA